MCQVKGRTEKMGKQRKTGNGKQGGEVYKYNNILDLNVSIWPMLDLGGGAKTLI